VRTYVASQITFIRIRKQTTFVQAPFFYRAWFPKKKKKPSSPGQIFETVDFVPVPSSPKQTIPALALVSCRA
jgi:hypothetical protein